jgi:nucleoside-diphosphate-sugar epimerase
MMNAIAGTPVLVTGGTGFLGSHLARRLAADGASLTLAVRPNGNTERIADLMPAVSLIEADLTDPDATRTLVRSAAPQLVFHLAADVSGRDAADDPAAWSRSVEINLLGTLNLLNAVRQHVPAVARIIRAGGIEEYGNGPAPFRETQREQAVSPYSAGQVAATQISHAVAPQWNLPLVTIRPSIIYGPAQDTRFFIPGLITACLDGRDFAMTRGEQSSDFVYVADVVDALMLTAEANDIDGEIFNVGSGESTVVRDLAEQIVRRSGASIDLQLGAVPARAGESALRFLDITKSEHWLGWQPSTCIEAGLDQTIAWYSRSMDGDR